MTVVDTTVWIEYLRGAANDQTLWLDRHLGAQPLALTDLIYCEVLQGIRSDIVFAKLQRDLERFTIFDSGGALVALSAARNYRELRRRGITVRKTIDCLIASFCILQSHELLYRDRDFDVFELELGLRVVHP